MNHRLDRSQAHYEWNNSLSPRLTIAPGDTVSFETPRGGAKRLKVLAVG